MILASALRAETPSNGPGWSAMDDRWYMPDLGVGAFGAVSLSPETLLRCSAVLSALRFLGTSVALCKPQIIQYVGEERRRRPDHYAERALRNPWKRHTGFEWWELNTVWHSVFGNAYNRILPSETSPIGRLQPLPPWHMRVIDTDRDGGLIFRYSPPGHAAETLSEDDLLRFPGISMDGREGVRMYQLVQNVVSIAMLAERHTSQFLKKGARIAGMLVPKGDIEPEAANELAANINAAIGGPNSTGQLAVMPTQVEFTPFSVSNKESQLIELADGAVGHILRFWGVPGVVVGWNDGKTTTYASADAFFEKGGTRICLLPLLTRLEGRVDHSLIFEDDVYCKMNLKVLERADTVNRYAALFRAVGRPWMTGNEARSIEDMNPSDDPNMSRVAMPTNLTTDDLEADATGSRKPPRMPRQAPDDGDTAALRGAVRVDRARRLALQGARRVVMRELEALKGRVPLAARDPGAWKAWVIDYYGRHVATVAYELAVDEDFAEAYALRQREALLSEGMAATETWERDLIPSLASQALGD